MGSRRSRHTRPRGSGPQLTYRGTAVFIALAVLITPDAAAQRKEVIGYYLASEYPARDTLVTPLRLPYEKLTIINYAFFYPTPEGRLIGRAPEADKLILGGTPDPATGAARKETALCATAHSRGVRVLLSLGGWEESGNFPAVAANADRRRAFAASCADAIRRYDFDGIDIDWEYPGYEPHNGTPEDGGNYLLLLREVRDTLDALGRLTGQRFMLTIAVPAGAAVAAPFDVRAAAPLLDFINIMTYDFHGAWDPTSGHNAPLFPSARGDSSRCVDAGFRLYRDVYGIPADRLTVGAPFYGRSFRSCTDLHAPHTGSDAIRFPPDGTPRHHELAATMDSCSRRWDDLAKVPYLVCPAWNCVVSYDDDESMALKAQYVIDNGIRGIIVWELSGDFRTDGSTPLLDTIHRIFTAAPPAK